MTPGKLMRILLDKFETVLIKIFFKRFSEIISELFTRIFWQFFFLRISQDFSG